jgi:hypothetical protein
MAQDTKTKKAARLFDVRLVIGGLFTVYGVIVALLGLFDNHSEIEKAQGVRINLWMGLGMLALGLLMLLWLKLNPLPTPEPKAPEESPDTRPENS